MEYRNLQKMARNHGIKCLGMTKIDMIRAIQRSGKNIDCFCTFRLEYCRELSCMWREDCIALYWKNRFLVDARA